jgi:hypothetical protein
MVWLLWATGNISERLGTLNVVLLTTHYPNVTPSASDSESATPTFHQWSLTSSSTTEPAEGEGGRREDGAAGREQEQDSREQGGEIRGGVRARRKDQRARCAGRMNPAEAAVGDWEATVGDWEH